VSEIRKRIKAPTPDGWQVLADAVDRVREQIRESFGPRQEVRLVTDPELAAARALKETLDQVRPLVVEATAEEMGDPHAARRLTAEALKKRIRQDVLTLCGFEEGGEVTYDGSASNDLASERAEAIMKIIEAVRLSNWPEGYVPLDSDAAPSQRLQAIRQHLINLCKERPGEPGEFGRASERADVALAFVNLVRTHPDPRRLLPRGDQLGEWLPPGTPVVVHLGGFEHPAVVEPSRDTVTVRLAKANVVTEYPRNLISKEGEPWTPPKPTSD